MKVNKIDVNSSWQQHCPIELSETDERITLAHGEGGRLMRKLIGEHIARALNNDILIRLEDAARLPQLDGPVAMSTDSYVVSPLFFPGGDIGSLAVYGTVNDLAVCGAKPLYLSLSLIIEEGFSLPLLDCVLKQIAKAADCTDVKIVTGDTKVVPKGAVDGLFINTTGIGQLVAPVPRGPQALQIGDALIVSGPIGRHGIAVLAAREDLAFEPAPQTDSAPLIQIVAALRKRLGKQICAMRDATRGGVAAVLHEWAEACQLTMSVEENQIPVTSDVRGACELLGLDPLHIANEGTMVIAVTKEAANDALAVLHSFREHESAAQIGHITKRGVAPVTVRRLLGTEQALDDLLGAPLPRIC